MTGHVPPPIDALYTAVVGVEGGRAGQCLVSTDQRHLQFAYPKELGGDGNGINPEQLFAAAYGACFASALDLEARSRRRELKAIGVTSHVTLGHACDGSFGLSIALHVRLPGLDSVEAEGLARAAYAGCPYSRAIWGNVRVDLVLEADSGAKRSLLALPAGLPS